MTPSAARQLLIDRLERDLVGPDAPDDVIDDEGARPSDVYLTGMLWPIGDRMGGAEDDGSEGDDEGAEGPSAPGLNGQQRPCSMGISFATTSTNETHCVTVHASFATYVPEDYTDREDGRRRTKWQRQEHEFTLTDLALPTNGTLTRQLTKPGLEARVQLHVRGQRTGSGLIATVTLINRSRAKDRDRRTMEQLTLFQTGLEIESGTSTAVVPRPGIRIANDEDDLIARLLYRDCPEFAVGHQCSVGWKAEGRVARTIFSRWIPRATVTAFREDGHDVFASAVSSGAFAADSLARASDAELASNLDQLPAAYEQWLALQNARVSGLPENLQEIAAGNLATCRAVLDRVRAGIRAITSDARLQLAFRLANAAMSLQHSWKPENARSPLKWRPFQLGFILLAAESTCHPGSDDRLALDLLWFPTGGGKTEAYLALVAMLSFHRRLTAADPDAGAGNAAVMRYTLRLLTAQQFERATALILACELIRRGLVKSALQTTPLGHLPFSIGLWVGGDATPNNFQKALETSGQRDGSTAEQIDACPQCRKRVTWIYDEDDERVQPCCKNEACQLGPRFGLWPVYTVDTDIYRERPTLLIGTVDKFALLPLRKEIADVFGFDADQKTDLIIQDELHLISGPLGTVAGLYETAFDWLLISKGRRPKIVGSTATIRRAASQVRALFDRTSWQFPPPGLDHDDSGFAVRDEKTPGRTYVAVTTTGRSAKFTLQAVAGSLLQSGGPASFPDPAERDGYATLVCYFNSLRELGGAIVQMLDDVPDSIGLYSRRRNEAGRRVKPPEELTSRVSQKEIVRALSELKRTAADLDCIDVVLATNMVSVGVDVPRLGLMIVNGQPKMRSEYIQATSRVGRSRFPGLIVSVLNAAKPRDRSHFETFPSWHGTLYRDVEATSVTPFASRARDRAMHAALVAMIRHGDASMREKPDLNQAPDRLLSAVVEEIERRIGSIDPDELSGAREEIDKRMGDWESRAPATYLNDHKPNSSLLQSAERHARRRAAGRLSGAAWPTMYNMRTVEPSTRFRMTEALTDRPRRAADEVTGVRSAQRRWRRPNG